MLEVDEERIQRYFERLVKLLVPFLIVGVVILILHFMLDWLIFTRVVGAMALYFVPPAGKESIIPILIGVLKITPHVASAPFDITLVALTIAFMDIIVALFLIWNFDLVEKIPLLGDWIRRLEGWGAAKLKERPWIRRGAFTAVMLFVMFPLQGSGGVGATVMGKVIGMESKRVFAAITIGALIGCFFISTIAYYTGEAMIRAFKAGAAQGAAVVFIAIVIICVAYLVKVHYIDSKI